LGKKQKVTGKQVMTASLYDQLGGATGIAEIVDAVVDAHMRNPAIRARFAPYRDQPERLGVVKGHLRNFFAAGSGGPETYSGRSMPEAHRGMNLSHAEYFAAVDDILTTLEARGISESARKDVLAIVYSLKGDIMHV
jgi:hemoglobin